MKDGIPPGWNLELRHGKPDIQIERPDLSGLPPLKRRSSFGWGEAQASVQQDPYCLHLTSDGESSFGISRNMKVNPKEFPYLNWKWAASRLPDGADVRKRSTDDQAAQVYVVFTPTGFPHALTAPLLGYIWDTESPKGTTGKNAHPLAGRVRYIVLRNKTDRLGQLDHGKAQHLRGLPQALQGHQRRRAARGGRRHVLHQRPQHEDPGREPLLRRVFHEELVTRG